MPKPPARTLFLRPVIGQQDTRCKEMQVRCQFEATPARTLVAVFLALAALLVTGALGYSLGKANGAGHATAAPGHSVVLPASQAAGQTLDDYSFRYGPADR